MECGKSGVPVFVDSGLVFDTGLEEVGILSGDEVRRGFDIFRRRVHGDWRLVLAWVE